jgi:hypothetical protein
VSQQIATAPSAITRAFVPSLSSWDPIPRWLGPLVPAFGGNLF